MEPILPDISEFDDLFEGLDSFEGLDPDPSTSLSPATVSASDQDSETESESSIAEATPPPPQEVSASAFKVPTIPTSSAPFVFGNDAEKESVAEAKPPPTNPLLPSFVPSKALSVFMPFANASLFAAAAATMAAQNPSHLPQTNPPDKRKREAPRVETAAEEREARRRRNREASDRSRAKRRALLQSLPEQNSALEKRVVELERGLSASQAEASALREQVSFLQTLLSGKGGSNISFASTLGSVSAASASAASAVSATSPSTGVALLAIVCVLSVHHEQGGDFSYFGSSSDNMDWDSSRVSRGGRVLLGIEEHEHDHHFWMSVVIRFVALGAVYLLLRPVTISLVGSIASWTRSARLPQWKKSHSM